jgi:hypothetical protein
MGRGENPPPSPARKPGKRGGAFLLEPRQQDVQAELGVNLA